MKNKSELRKVPTKNYFIVLGLFILVILLIIYLRAWYKVEEERRHSIPVISGVLSQEIKEEELNHVVVDNQKAIVYMCNAKSVSCRTFEKRFKKLILNNDYQYDIIYLNLSESENFSERFNQKYKFKKELKEKYPAFVVFEDGKVKSILQKDKLSVEDVKDFLKGLELGE